LKLIRGNKHIFNELSATKARVKTREILFRGWESEHQCWVHGSFNAWFTGIDTIQPAAGPQCRVLKESIGQYVGIVCNKGLKIFEGDIVEVNATAIGGECVSGQVTFNTDPTLGQLGWCLWLPSNGLEHGGYYATDFLGKLTLLAVPSYAGEEEE